MQTQLCVSISQLNLFSVALWSILGHFILNYETHFCVFPNKHFTPPVPTTQICFCSTWKVQEALQKTQCSRPVHPNLQHVLCFNSFFFVVQYNIFSILLYTVQHGHFILPVTSHNKTHSEYSHQKSCQTDTVCMTFIRRGENFIQRVLTHDV